MNSVYDKKALIKYVAIFVLSLFALKYTDGHAMWVIMPALIFSARNKPENLIFCLAFGVCTIVSNKYFVPRSISFALAQRASMFLMAAMMFVQITASKNSKVIAPLGLIFIYIIYMILPSLMGWNWIISSLKLVLFSALFMAYYGISNRAILNQHGDVTKIRSAILSFIIVFVFGSLIVLPFTTIAFMGKEELLLSGEMPKSLFKGMAVHSQTLGPLIAVVTILLCGDLFFNIKKPNKLYLALLLCCPYLLYRTSSRTAMVSMLFGVIFLVYMMIQARGIGSRWKTKVISTSMALIVACSAFAMLSGAVRESISRFVTKSWNENVEAEVTVEQVTATRMFLVERALDNFNESPTFGNGFQISKDYKDYKIESLAQVLSAPIEKGVWVVAVLEEGGAIGFIFFVCAAIAIIAKLWGLKAYIGCVMFSTMLVINLGEFSMFALSYLGGFIWLCVFTGLILDGIRLREQDRVNYYGGYYAYPTFG